MDKIDIRDLRVGDWVEYNGNFIQVENIHKDMINYVPEIPYVQEEDFIEVTCIAPIPLTSDICDQVNDGHVILLWDDKKYEETGETWYELDLCNTPDKTVCINIQYVHQLQNLLRDMGIEKEITI